MILLWGAPGDSPLDSVRTELERRGANVFLLDQRLGARTSVRLEILHDGTVSGEIETPQRLLDLKVAKAAYIRPLETAKASGAASLSDPDYLRAAAADMAIIAWANLTCASVVNRPEAMTANNSKPYQLSLISAFGFHVPETLITTDANGVRRFCKRHKNVVYKSVSGVRSIVSRLSALSSAALADVANCPTQFQEYVPGTDVRVHVIGESVIATEITSSADDYRYASRFGLDLTMTPAALPDAVADSCRLIARDMHLLFAGVDLRRTSDGRWYCFEVNPSPGFTFFEAITGQAIAASVADLLLRLDGED
jgi:glutathione synthase/RimK-type ligase-like ATP-grasp enzyme